MDNGPSRGALLIGTGASVGFLWKHQHVGLYREKYEAERQLARSTPAAMNS